jgi:signal transduction histidine kinase
MGSSIRGQAERISRLADDLYEMSRLESHSLLLSPRVVPLARVVRSALESVDGAAAGVHVDIASELEVLADARRLEQVVANLVDNALQHGQAPVRVTSFVGDGGTVGLSVVDTGLGVPPTLVPTLFSRLRTLSRPNRDRSRGSGLGLSLVQGLVEAMGGRVWYEPGAGGGAAFHLTLPAPGGRPPA